MAEKKAAARAVAADADAQSKAQLQRRIEETRDSISHTVEEIKDTVSDQYEAVKDTVADVIGWNEEFKKNPVVWGLGALSVGLIVGYSIAAVRQDGPPSSRRRGRNDSSANNFFDGISRVGMNVVLPAVTNKIKELFGVDLSEQLMSLASGEPERRVSRTTRKRRSPSKKAPAKKRATKKKGTK